MRYSETLLEHFLRPRNAGLMQEPDGVGEQEYAGVVILPDSSCAFGREV